jgi:phosphatidylglycerophosphate synthase
VTENYNTLPTLQEIRDAHGWKRDYEKYLPLSRFIFRPLGFLLTWLAIRTGWTTESVACLSGIVGIAGCLCLMSGWQSLLPFGIGLLLAFNLLDCVDGSIARTMKTENPYGKFLDSVCGGLIDLAFWGVLGVAAFRNPELLTWQNPLGYGAAFWLAVGSATCFLSIHVVFLENIFDRSLRKDWNKLQMSKEAPRGVIEPEENSTLSSKNGIDRRYMLRMINNNLRVRETHYLLLIVAYLTRAVDLLLGAYLIYYIFQNTISLIVYSKRGRQIRRFYS